MLLRIALLAALAINVASQGCAKRELPHGIVCVCNSTYCDRIEPVGKLKDDEALLYTTNLAGARMKQAVIKKSPSPKNPLVLVVDPATTFQDILGFGGSFTDSTGINLLSLSNATRDRLVRSMAREPLPGSEYTMGRVPIASTDFSLRNYSYNEVDGDFGMENFALAQEDYLYKLPFLRQAIALQQGLGGLKLVAAPWSAPAWMKSNHEMIHGGKLRGFEGGPYHAAWAGYLVRFFEEYDKEGVKCWALEVQNEPRSAVDQHYRWQSMYWSPESEGNFIARQLSPALKFSPVTANLLIFGLTDQRGALPEWPQKLFANNPLARSHTDGLSVHWYEDDFKGADLLTQTHEKFPEKILLMSEASNGFMDPKPIRMRPGDWQRAEKYAKNIIEDLNNWVSGWIDWNMALDMQGGPSWVENWLDATILVDAAEDEFLKQPSYYALAHFSKFIKPGAKRVKMEGGEEEVEAFAAITKDGKKVVVLMNTKEETVRLSLMEKEKEGCIEVEMTPSSMKAAGSSSPHDLKISKSSVQ